MNLIDLISITLNEGVNTAKQYVKSGKLTQEQFNKLLEIDPSKKYVDWLAVQFVKGGDESVFGQKIANILSNYDDLYSRKIVKTSIDKVKSVQELTNIVDENSNVASKRETKKADVSSGVFKGLKSGEDYDVLMDKENFTAYGVYNKKASCTIGKDSGWCVTLDKNKEGEDSPFWNMYSKGGKFFIFVIDKVNKSSDHSLGKGTSGMKVDYSDKHSADTWAIYVDDSNKITYVDKANNETSSAPSAFKKNIGLSESEIINLFSKHKKMLNKPKLVENPSNVQEVIGNLIFLGIIEDESEVEIV
jgi:hypothetical protein